ncbi:hypothetical protein GKA74_22980 [Vibrio parahaemolyticus]|nr:hypothetical protein [Vibrio parahaemolyticus]EGQ8699946.1 hypothetical protein [Vibrio parahaemolyticus]EGQ8751253.1 hypothetical protein [Vibrio parahaemolyticus]EGQ8756071.1 hypothetical protein [Vibrio parahaemolyticus]EGQ8773807.1 hypothetical protein [Vibrio parahaemolyticus]
MYSTEQKLVDELFHTAECGENLFDLAIASLNTQMNEEYAVLKRELDTAEKRYDDWKSDYDAKNQATDEYVEFSIDEYNDLVLDCQASQAHSEYISDQVFALVEMQVIYSFKQLEITLKSLLSLAFDNVDKKSLFNWKSLKKEYNSRNVKISEADNYVPINQLRVVNNALKHSSKITQEVKDLAILEFRNLELFDYESLNSFYQRIKGGIKIFLLSVVCMLVSSLGLSHLHWRTNPNRDETFEFDMDIPF